MLSHDVRGGTIRVVIDCDLLGVCTSDDCRALAIKEFSTLNMKRYSEGVSCRRLVSHDAEEPFAEHRTARKRALRAQRKGYRVTTFEPCTRHEDMLAINRSTPARQGRPMDEAYVNLKPTSSLIGKPSCDRHNVLMYGVLTERGRLVAYAGIYRCGDLAHVSQFLGHADFLDDGIMYLIMDAIIRSAVSTGATVLFYNRHDSGSDGLRWYKERVGLKPEGVKWTLGT